MPNKIKKKPAQIEELIFDRVRDNLDQEVEKLPPTQYKELLYMLQCEIQCRLDGVLTELQDLEQ